MEYGGHIAWGFNKEPRSLDKIQSKALNTIADAANDCWLPGLENEFGMVSLSLRREKSLLKFYHKISNMDPSRIPVLIFNRIWKKKSNLSTRNLMGATARRWKLDANPHRFGFTLDENLNPEHIDEYWDYSEKGLCNSDKSRNCWNALLNDKLGQGSGGNY